MPWYRFRYRVTCGPNRLRASYDRDAGRRQPDAPLSQAPLSIYHRPPAIQIIRQIMDARRLDTSGLLSLGYWNRRRTAARMEVLPRMLMQVFHRKIRIRWRPGQATDLPHLNSPLSMHPTEGAHTSDLPTRELLLIIIGIRLHDVRIPGMHQMNRTLERR